MSDTPSDPANPDSAASAEPVSFADRGWYVVTEFPQQRGRGFNKVIDLAQRCPGYQKLADPAEGVIYRNLFRVSDLDAFAELWPAIARWKEHKVYWNGHAAEGNPFLALGAECFRTRFVRLHSCPLRDWIRGAADLPDAFGCSSGVLRIKWTGDVHEDEPHWFAFGAFDSKGRWVIRHDDIRAFLRGTVHKIGFCPVGNRNFFDRMWEAFPRHIAVDGQMWQKRDALIRAAAARDRRAADFLLERLPPVVPANGDAYNAMVKGWLAPFAQFLKPLGDVIPDPRDEKRESAIGADLRGVDGDDDADEAPDSAM
jgi:hypothetical protein